MTYMLVFIGGIVFANFVRSLQDDDAESIASEGLADHPGGPGRSRLRAAGLWAAKARGVVERVVSKGNNRRASAVDDETVAENWARTFGAKPEVYGAIPPARQVAGAIPAVCGCADSGDCFICDEVN